MTTTTTVQAGLRKQTSRSILRRFLANGQEGTGLEKQKQEYKAWQKSAAGKKDRNCVLHFACQHDFTDLLEYKLVKFQDTGVESPPILNSMDQSALQVAVNHGNIQCAQLLFQLAGSLYLQRVFVGSILSAVENHDLEMLNWLLNSEMAFRYTNSILDLGALSSPLTRAFHLKHYDCAIQLIRIRRPSTIRFSVQGEWQILQSLLDDLLAGGIELETCRTLVEYLIGEGMNARSCTISSEALERLVESDDFGKLQVLLDSFSDLGKGDTLGGFECQLVDIAIRRPELKTTKLLTDYTIHNDNATSITRAINARATAEQQPLLPQLPIEIRDCGFQAFADDGTSIF